MTDDAEAHKEKKAKVKAARDKMMAGKTDEKGLVIVHTGKGKGKTTAAMGMVARCMGRGKRVGIVQFIKGAWETGELMLFDKFPDLCTFYAMGEGFTWETQDKERDIAAATKAFEKAKELINDPSYSMVLLDEINIALRYDYIPLEDVLDVLQNKRDDLHIVLTGRNAKDELMEMADLVTEMTQIKHPFRAGIKAQEGVEF